MQAQGQQPALPTYAEATRNPPSEFHIPATTPYNPTYNPPYPIQTMPPYTNAPITIQNYSQPPGAPPFQTYGQAPGVIDDGPRTIHIIRHVSTGSNGCGGRRGVWLGILIGFIILVVILRASYREY